MADHHFKVVTLCGSTRFKKEFEDCAQRLTLEGNIVINISPFWRGESRELDTDILDMFQNMHYQRIDMSDAIAVVNPCGYIGEATRKEIKYAQEHDKEILYMYAPYFEDPVSEEILDHYDKRPLGSNIRCHNEKWI